LSNVDGGRFIAKGAKDRSEKSGKKVWGGSYVPLQHIGVFLNRHTRRRGRVQQRRFGSAKLGGCG